MGFIKTNYTIEKLGITLPTAYAKIIDVRINKDGKAYAVFAVQKGREEIGTFRPLDQITINMTVDKTAPIFEQLYNKAKENIFADWEDHIVDEDIVVEDETIEEEENTTNEGVE